MIDVINYHSFDIAIRTKDRGYLVEAMKNGIPTRLPLELEEIRYINTSSNAFKLGLLFFDESVEQEMYEKELRIHYWRDILRPSEIKNILLNADIEGLTRILNIKDIIVFEIVRGIFTQLKNEDYNISVRLDKIISQRFTELNNRIYDTRILLKPKDVEIPITSQDVESIKQENSEMKTEIESLKQMVEQLLNTKKNETKSQDVDVLKAEVKEGKQSKSRTKATSTKKTEVTKE
jgi:hypothetical protein